jgi:uncharacterized protein (DUF1697 family)
MADFIAMLRGINVSGQKKIRMTDLQKLFEDLSFTNVRTYIQSGNVLFASKLNDKKVIRTKIENKILDKFGYKVELILKTHDELQRALDSNPFLRDKKKNSDRIYFTFLFEKPSQSNIKLLTETDFTPEQFIFNNDVIYLFVPNGYGRAKLNNNFFEKKLGVSATTRNYKTIKTLLTLSGNQ